MNLSHTLILQYMTNPATLFLRESLLLCSFPLFGQLCFCCLLHRHPCSSLLPLSCILASISLHMLPVGELPNSLHTAQLLRLNGFITLDTQRPEVSANTGTADWKCKSKHLLSYSQKFTLFLPFISVKDTIIYSSFLSLTPPSPSSNPSIPSVIKISSSTLKILLSFILFAPSFQLLP